MGERTGKRGKEGSEIEMGKEKLNMRIKNYGENLVKGNQDGYARDRL